MNKDKNEETTDTEDITVALDTIQDKLENKIKNIFKKLREGNNPPTK